MLLHTTTKRHTNEHTTEKKNNNNNNKKRSIDINHHQNQMQGARQSDVFFGERESGQDVRQSNVTAVQAVANIVKSSLGPVGLDKVSNVFEGKSQRVGIGIVFFSLSAAESASSRARRLKEVLYRCKTRRNTDHRSSSLTSSFLF